MAVRPVKKRTVARSKSASVDPPRRMDCSCRQPQSVSWTVTCGRCGKWYHGSCINFPEEDRELIDKLYCKFCTKKYRLASKWHLKCRLEACHKPAASDSGFCSKAHSEEFWKAALDGIGRGPDLVLSKWLLHNSRNGAAFAEATPGSLPKPPLHASPELEMRKQSLAEATRWREENGKCGFDPRLVGLDGPRCDEDIKACVRHSNWPSMVSNRIRLDEMTEQDQTEPDPAWVAKRAKFLVAGTTRYSKRRGFKAHYFLPYIWDDGDRDYFLNDDPEPFWEKHF